MDWTDFLQNGYWIFLVGTAYSVWRLRRGTGALAEGLGAHIVGSKGFKRVLKGRQDGRRWRLELTADGNSAGVNAHVSVRLEAVPTSVSFARRRTFRLGGGPPPLVDIEEDLPLKGAARSNLLFADRHTRAVLALTCARFDVSLKKNRLSIKKRFNSMDIDTAQEMIDALVRLAAELSVPAPKLVSRASRFVQSDGDVEGRRETLRRILRRETAATVAMGRWAMDGDEPELASDRLFDLAGRKGWTERLLRPQWSESAPEDALPAYLAALHRSFDPRLEPVLINLLGRMGGRDRDRVIERLGHRGGRDAVLPLQRLNTPRTKSAIERIQARLGGQGGGLAVVKDVALAGALALEESAGALALVKQTPP